VNRTEISRSPQFQVGGAVFSSVLMVDEICQIALSGRISGRVFLLTQVNMEASGINQHILKSNSA
jgi:hypothetical protein